VICAAFQIQGQTTDDYKAQRERAFALCDANKMVEALPILAKLLEANQNDVGVIEKLGQALLGVAVVESNPESRKEMLTLVHQLGERAKALGDNSSAVKLLLEVPTDGAVPSNSNPYNTSKEATDAMDVAEKAFATGDMETAFANHKKALDLDPKLYEAALYAGDACMKLSKADDPGIWYNKAILINPDRETAYRYWGDVLSKAGRQSEARVKFIEAIVADPFTNRSWSGLTDWAQKARVQLVDPGIKVPKTNISKNEKGDITLNLNTNDLTKGPDPWFTYSVTKSLWMNGTLFHKAYPNETEYRHSLAEEVQALGMVADSAAKDIKDGKIKDPDDTLKNLIKLKEQGMLEPYILLFMADKGIAADYKDYRAQHRDKLVAYLKQLVPEPK